MSRLRRTRCSRRRRRGDGAHGLVLLTLLIALILVSVALLAALDVWALQRQRLQEEELLFVGNQYRLAIQRYYMAGRTLPASVDDLLDDKRFPVPLHHLRRAYLDPITGKNDWLFLHDGDRIYGVYSKSTAPTVKHANFPGATRISPMRKPMASGNSSICRQADEAARAIRFRVRRIRPDKPMQLPGAQA